MLMMMEPDNRGPVFPNIHIRSELECVGQWLDTSSDVDDGPRVRKIRRDSVLF